MMDLPILLSKVCYVVCFASVLSSFTISFMHSFVFPPHPRCQPHFDPKTVPSLVYYLIHPFLCSHRCQLAHSLPFAIFSSSPLLSSSFRRWRPPTSPSNPFFSTSATHHPLPKQHPHHHRRGSGQSRNVGGIENLASSLLSLIPDAGKIDLNYPATLDDYVSSESQGTRNMTWFVERFVDQWSEVGVVLMGYSQVAAGYCLEGR